MFDFLTINYLENLGIKGCITKGVEVWMNCPFHNEEKPSSKINLETGRFKCFGCGKSLGVMEFLLKNGKKITDFNMEFFRQLVRAEKNNIYEKRKNDKDILKEFRDRKKGEEITHIKDDFLLQFTNKKFPKRLVDTMGYDHLLKYEIMLDEKNNTIVFPVRDIDGYLIAVAGREYYTGKFFFYKVIYKGILGINRALYSNKVIIVEGLRDWLLLSKMKTPVLCLMGSELSKKGVESLKRLREGKLDEIILGLDNDKTGERAYEKICGIILKENLCDKLYKITPTMKDWMEMYENGIDLYGIENEKKTYLEYKVEKRNSQGRESYISK